QFLHEHAHHAAGHIYPASQISSGNWLMLTDKIKGDVPVNIARCCARGNVEIPGIDLTHRRLPVLFEMRTISPARGAVKTFFAGSRMFLEQLCEHGKETADVNCDCPGPQSDKTSGKKCLPPLSDSMGIEGQSGLVVTISIPS